MRNISDIRELARFLFESGYKSEYRESNVPPYQQAIQKVMKLPGSNFVDSFGFVSDKDAKRLYLTQQIDFAWLRTQVQLHPPLIAIEAHNIIGGEYEEILGGNLPSPTTMAKVKKPWWQFWGSKCAV